MILKVLVGFLFGFILGVGGTIFLVATGTGNYLIASNPRVQELEAKIREVERERTFATRRLEEVAGLTEKMASRFEELQRRFESLELPRAGGAPTSLPPERTPPGTAAGPGRSPGAEPAPPAPKD